jgi:hypothetical protein
MCEKEGALIHRTVSTQSRLHVAASGESFLGGALKALEDMNVVKLSERARRTVCDGIEVTSFHESAKGERTVNCVRSVDLMRVAALRKIQKSLYFVADRFDEEKSQ